MYTANNPTKSLQPRTAAFGLELHFFCDFLEIVVWLDQALVKYVRSAKPLLTTVALRRYESFVHCECLDSTLTVRLRADILQIDTDVCT